MKTKCNSPPGPFSILLEPQTVIQKHTQKQILLANVDATFVAEGRIYVQRDRFYICVSALQFLRTGSLPHFGAIPAAGEPLYSSAARRIALVPIFDAVVCMCDHLCTLLCSSHQQFHRVQKLHGHPVQLQPSCKVAEQVQGG